MARSELTRDSLFIVALALLTFADLLPLARQIGKTTGTLKNFLIEPFLPHAGTDEYYICIQSVREGDEILFTHEGGVDVGDVDEKAKKLMVRVDGAFPSADQIKKELLAGQ
jgi:ATP citrate (pro-S)-lyase